MRHIKLNMRLVALVVGGVAILSVMGLAVWAGTPQGELMDEVGIALESDADVRVSNEAWIAFEPVGNPPTAGYIFYPGGRVLAEAYAPTARAVAEQGYLAVIVRVPLNLAFFDTNAAQRVIDAYPAIEHWVVGGHSLGGVAASTFAADHPAEVGGLVLLASYPAPWIDLSLRDDLRVVSIYGTEDGLAKAGDVKNSAEVLPSDATFVPIEGGNHGNFGWYGPQPGDNPATISRDAQQQQVVAAVVALLEALSQDS